MDSIFIYQHLSDSQWCIVLVKSFTHSFVNSIIAMDPTYTERSAGTQVVYAVLKDTGRMLCWAYLFIALSVVTIAKVLPSHTDTTWYL